MKEILSIFAFIFKTIIAIIDENVRDAFVASKEAKSALRKIKKECKAKIRYEIDCNGGYLVFIKKLGLELHISRSGIVREADLAEEIGAML